MLLENIIEFKSSPDLRKKIIDFGITKNFLEGDIILNENSYIKLLPIIIKGNIRVIGKDEDGREILLYYIREGESCIMSFLGGIHRETRKVIAIAEEETEILFIPTEKVNLLIKENPEWLEYIFHLYHKRYEELLNVINAVAFKNMDERLYDLIRMKCEMIESRTLHVTHEQLANELGTVRVVISRLLKNMEDNGLVLLGRNKITFLKR